MPLYTSEPERKLPTFKQWLTQSSSVKTGKEITFVAKTIFLPNKFPDLTFVTEEFRYSLRPTEDLLAELKIAVERDDEGLLLFYNRLPNTMEIYTASEYRETFKFTFQETPELTGTWKTTDIGYFWTQNDSLPNQPETVLRTKRKRAQ